MIRPERHFDEMPTYTANLCRLFRRVEFAGFREDFGQPIGESVETASRRAIRQRSTEHFDCVLSKEQRVNNAIQAGARGNCGCLRLWDQMPRLRAGQTELALQITRSNLDVTHRHPWIGVAE